MDLYIRTNKKREVIDITEQIQNLLNNDTKAVMVFVAHTTCAVTTADLDPGAGEDLAKSLWEMVPKLDYSSHHDPQHFPAHIIGSAIGPSVSLPVKGGHLALGTWQRVVLVEMDGPRDRKIYITQIT